jgi:hypothetical protein
MNRTDMIPVRGGSWSWSPRDASSVVYPHGSNAIGRRQRFVGSDPLLRSTWVGRRRSRCSDGEWRTRQFDRRCSQLPSVTPDFGTSDGDRSYTYSSCETSPIAEFRATSHVFPARIAHVALGNRSWVEWRAAFDCAEADRPRWAALLSHSFARSFESLKWYLSRETDARKRAHPRCRQLLPRPFSSSPMSLST